MKKRATEKKKEKQLTMKRVGVAVVATALLPSWREASRQRATAKSEGKEQGSVQAVAQQMEGWGGCFTSFNASMLCAHTKPHALSSLHLLRHHTLSLPFTFYGTTRSLSPPALSPALCSTLPIYVFFLLPLLSLSIPCYDLF